MSPRLVVLISGNGSNLQALLDATARGDLDAEVALVVSNRKAAHGLRRAEAAGVEALYFPLGPFGDQGRAAYDAALAEAIANRLDPDLIVLAGWMHILGPAFLDRFEGKVINLHPALPGAFPGKDAIARAHAACAADGLTCTGVMVHRVVPEVDAGPTIVAEEVVLRPDEPLEALAERIHAVEHRLIVEAVRKELQAGG